MARDLQPCGTEAAYRRHLRKEERPCEECLAANAQEKAWRTDAKRGTAAQAAQAARPEPAPFDQVAVLEEVLAVLRGQLAEAPPQSVAAIAKQVRDTSAELAQALGATKPSASTANAGGGIHDIARRRAEREARRGAAAQA